MATRPRTIGNPVARSPLMRKGGPHRRGRSGERRIQREEVAAALEQWYRDDRVRREKAVRQDLDIVEGKLPKRCRQLVLEWEEDD